MTSNVGRDDGLGSRRNVLGDLSPDGEGDAMMAMPWLESTGVILNVENSVINMVVFLLGVILYEDL